MEKERVSLEYCRSEDQLDDIFTKPLSKEVFVKLRTMLGMVKIPVYIVYIAWL